MIDDLKPYPAMKYSGVSWVGEVPKHWELRKLKYAVSFAGGGTPSKANALFWNGHIPWVSPKDMRSGRITDATDHITEEAVRTSATSLVSPGAVIIVVRSGILRRTIPVAINEVRVALNQDMKALRPRPDLLKSEYLRALLQGNEGKLITEWTKQGATVESIEHEFLANSQIPLPPLPEQAAIVRFLDHVDRRIRRYIRAKQKLIKLLDEQKQAIIHRAVTRGLDPNVRLKPSGVEWLGDVPEHWEIATKLKYVSSLKGRLGWQGLKASEYTAIGPYVVSSAHFKNHRIEWERCPHVSEERYAMDTNIQLAEEDILLMKDGAAMGKLAFVDHLPGLACLNSHLLLFRPRSANEGRSYEPRFLYYFMMTDAFQDYVQVNGTGATFSGISQEALGNYKICLPPLIEQREIVSFLDSETALLGEVQAKIELQIDRLREYRTRLIADVVTGKLDVREVAARLPDEVEEPEALEEAEMENDVDADVAEDIDATEEAEA